MRFGLQDEHIASIVNVFAANSSVDMVLVFGSRAKGNFKPGSDIDLVMVGESLTFQDLVRLHGQLEDLYLPWKFDLVLRHHIGNNDVVDHIRRVGKVLYERVATTSEVVPAYQGLQLK